MKMLIGWMIVNLMALNASADETLRPIVNHGTYLEMEPRDLVGRYVIVSDRPFSMGSRESIPSGRGFYEGVIVHTKYATSPEGSRILALDILQVPRAIDKYKISQYRDISVSRVRTLVPLNKVDAPSSEPGLSQFKAWQESARAFVERARATDPNLRSIDSEDTQIVDRMMEEEATKYAVREGEVLSTEDQRFQDEALEKMSISRRARYWKCRIKKMAVKDAIAEAFRK
jgi:hypothetical protein